MSNQAMLDGMKRANEMKAAATAAGRQWVYCAVATDGQVILIYATGEIEGIETGVIFNRIPLLHGHAVAQKMLAPSGSEAALA